MNRTPDHVPDSWPQSTTEVLLTLNNDILESCSDAACRLLDRPREALLGQSLGSLAPPQQSDGAPSTPVLAQRLAAARAGLPQSFEWRLLGGDGQPLDLLLALEAIPGDADRLRARIKDLTALHRAEDALRDSETRLQQILDNTTAVVYVKDTAGRHLLANRYYQRLSHRREADILGHTDVELFGEAIAANLGHNDALVLSRRQPIEFEENVEFDGRPYTFLSQKFPLFDAAGQVYAVCGISTDISHRKRAEEALRNAALGVSSASGEEVFQDLARHLADSLGAICAFVGELTADGEHIQTLAIHCAGRCIPNECYELAGTPCASVVGRRFQCYPSGVLELFPGDELMQQLAIQSYAAYPLFDADNRPLGLIVIIDNREMTDPALIESVLKIFAARAAAELERRQAEDALRASEEQYRAVFNASVDGLALWSAEGKIVDANPAFCRIHGYGRDALMRMDPRRFIHPDSRDAFEMFLSTLQSDQPFHAEARSLHADGVAVDVEVHGVPMHYRGAPHLLSVVRDISGRKQAERERAQLEAQLRQSQKMEAIGHLTGGIAHDFNNILTGVTGYLAMALERAGQLEDDTLVRYLQRTQRSSQRAKELIRQMLIFSRGQRCEPRVLALPPLVRESVTLLRSTLPTTVEFHTTLAPDLPKVRLNPVQVEQILMNLCLNARDAMAGMGSLGVSLRHRRGLDEPCASCRQPVQGVYVELAVEDSGPGIPADVSERMFEPFYTTKGAGKGSGMGLSMVHGIVHEHGGHILVDSAPGRGAVFRENAEDSAPPPSVSTQESKPRSALSGRVLVVDDDEMVGDFMAELLTSWGLEVTLKNSGPQALATVSADPGHFDLVITDQIMPRLTGFDLARRLLALRPGLPVIIYTGYSDSLTEQQTREAGVRALLHKPVEPGELFTLARELLETA